MEKYELLCWIGQGAYGKVFKAKNLETNELVAVKRPRSVVMGNGLPASTLREISLLRTLSTDSHIVKLLDVEHVRPWNGDLIPVEPEEGYVQDDERSVKTPPSSAKDVPPRRSASLVYLIFEHLDMDLKSLMQNYRDEDQKFEPKLIKEFMYQMLTGICFCHSQGVLHRDLKPQNILVDTDRNHLKIGDFGLGREYNIPPKPYTNEVITLWYRAPELLLGCPHYSTPVDIWSLGCIFAELATLSPLFSASSEFGQLLLIFGGMGTPSKAEWAELTSHEAWNDNYPQWRPKDIRSLVPELDNDGIDLLLKMLVYNPSVRISAKMALSHPYFDDLDQ